MSLYFICAFLCLFAAMNEWEWQLLEDKTILNVVRIGDVEFKPGDRVRLKPRAGAMFLIWRWQAKQQ